MISDLSLADDDHDNDSDKRADRNSANDNKPAHIKIQDLNLKRSLDSAVAGNSQRRSRAWNRGANQSLTKLPTGRNELPQRNQEGNRNQGGNSKRRGRGGNREANQPLTRLPTGRENESQERNQEGNRNQGGYSGRQGRGGHRGANQPLTRLLTERENESQEKNQEGNWNQGAHSGRRGRGGTRGANQSVTKLPAGRENQTQERNQGGNRNQEGYYGRQGGGHHGANQPLTKLPTERENDSQERNQVGSRNQGGNSGRRGRGGTRGANQPLTRPPTGRENESQERNQEDNRNQGGNSGRRGRGGNRVANQPLTRLPTGRQNESQEWNQEGNWIQGGNSGRQGRGGGGNFGRRDRGGIWVANHPLTRLPTGRENESQERNQEGSRNQGGNPGRRGRGGNQGANQPLIRLPTGRENDSQERNQGGNSWRRGFCGNQGWRPVDRHRGTYSDTHQNRESNLLHIDRMRNYEGKDPAVILLSLGHGKSGLYELLNLPRQNMDMVKLTVSVIAKGCKCNTAPQNKTHILTTLIGSPFLTISVHDLLMKISTDVEDSQKTFQNVCEIALALFLNIPSTSANMNVLGFNTLIEGVMETLRTRTNVADELLEIFQEIQDLKDKRLTKIKNKGLSDKQNDSFAEPAPPDNFRDISVLPTIEDMDPNTEPFLRKSKVTGRYASSNDYLDVQFRLLREDFIQPLRNGIEEYQQTVRGENIISDIRVYTGVSIIRSICSRTDLLHRLQFDVSTMKTVNWQISKRLIFGSLVCLSSDEFHTFYVATVGDRDDKNLADGYINVKFEHELNEIDAIPADQKFVMVETTAYYEAYKHVLKGLQDIQYLPFERYIVESNSSVNPPSYLLDSPQFDLRPLVDEHVKLRGGDDNLRRQGRDQNYEFICQSNPAEKVNLLNNKQSWPDHELLNLDESQFAALQTALTKEFSVIQGPPGTGKTYVGLKIVKALLHNSSAWNYEGDIKRPMLIVCYTNHALDQFLEGISSFYDGKIVRVGSRISSDKIKKYSIREWRQKFHEVKHFKELGRIDTDNYLEIVELQRQIENVGQRIEAALRDILKEDELTHVMSRAHKEQLSMFFYKKMFRRFCPDSPNLMFEWLGIYGTIRSEMIQQEDEQIEGTEKGDEANEDLQREIMTNNRLLDVDETGCGGKFEQVVEDSLRHRRAIVAFDVTNFDADKTPHDGFKLTRQARKKLKQNLLKKINSRSRMTKVEADGVAHIWNIDFHKRWRLYRYWVSEHCNKLKEKISDLGEIYKSKCEAKKEVNLQKDKIIMTEATIIAMTTTGAARYQKILQEVNPRIIVVEEAAEVLEGHIITSLNAHCEQLILIGDHKQLRPNSNVYNLAVKYNLQISLFERMLKNGIHCDCLEIQHRMRPEISKLMKPIYPTLRDHSSVKTFDNVKGLAKNIVFIDHKFEEQHNEEMRSHSNSYEAEFISKLADYLLKQGYEKSQITILAAYSGQKDLLTKLLPKDRYQGIRITTVDNFQGEENDIILLSLVRSNITENIGFLKIENRVCVALSRARLGLYVIGNFGNLASQSPLWKEITTILKKSSELNEKLLLRCQNHPDDRGIEITKPRDFEKAPLGGCQKLCNARLQCGHSCNMACHPTDQKHIQYSCPKPCTKACKDGHPCKRKCYQECGGCQTIVGKIIPNCGHKELIKCSVLVFEHKCTHPCESTVELDCGHLCGNLCGFPHQCQAMIKKKWPCGHTGDIQCVQRDYAVCSNPCGSALECGHPCTGTCSECFSGRLHKPCGHRCTKNLICDHKCQSQCSYCLPCEEKCENRCEHSKCTRKCGNICFTCKEPCTWKCQHYICGKKCFEACDRPPCNHPCKKTLKCSHECIGLCGEPCPNLCRICNKDIVTEIFFGTEEEEDARFVQLKDCGHVIEYKSLDNWMKQGTSSSETILIQMKACPKCKTPIRRCVRYGSIINRLLQSVDAVKQTYIGNRTYIEKLRREIQRVLLRIPQTSPVLKNWPKFKKTSAVASTENYLLAIQNQLEFLTNMDQLIVKLKQVQENNRLLSLTRKKEYEAILKEFTMFVKWLCRDRMVFSNQELNDAQAEMKRLSLYLKFFNLIVTVDTSKVDLGKLEEDTTQCHALFTDGNLLTEIHLQTIKNTLKKMEKLAPSSGLCISEEERVMVVKAVGLSQGHWYKCKNGHPYVITECGGAMEESTCPVCDELIGGTNHRLREGNQVATEMDGASYAAWSEQANLENYQFDQNF